MALSRQRPGKLITAVCAVILGLLPASPRTSWAASLPSAGGSDRPSGTALIFYAEPQVSESLWPSLFQIVLHDLAAGVGELPDGAVLDKQPVILRGSDDLRGIAFPRIVSIKLLGRCDLPLDTRHLSGDGPMGWVLRVSGKVQPYIYIDCSRVAHVLEPATARMSRQRGQDAMTQAISRVLIHEWVHIATQNSAHSKRGLFQPKLSINDLITPADKTRLSALTR